MVMPLPTSLRKFEVMRLAVEAEIVPVVEHGLARHPLADPGLGEHVARPLLDQAGADALLDIVAAAVLDDDRVDPLQMQEMRQHQPGWARTDDSDLCPH